MRHYSLRHYLQLSFQIHPLQKKHVQVEKNVFVYLMPFLVEKMYNSPPPPSNEFFFDWSCVALELIVAQNPCACV